MWVVRDLYIKYLVIIKTVGGVDFEHVAPLSCIVSFFICENDTFCLQGFLAFLPYVSDENGHWKLVFEKTLCEIGNY